MTASTRQIRAARTVLDAIPETLREVREQRGHSLAHVAEQTGVNRVTLSGIENRKAYSGWGDYNPKLDTILAICDYLAPTT